ncbi:hypothetical protein KP509_14G097400 [Ceratopteris richardii]|uniref:Uncharacterized protein n=1 Tax=Ceratopteris richardii TaxID=49495 RepID=A0A8T2TAM0_CERRI|nr:hypothetical protein KP509_14G097400 [Ceratopteris richardii]
MKASGTSFSVVRKKTPFQKHREEEEAKKKRADEDAARLYEEFVESFKADDGPGAKAFVRGGIINPDSRDDNQSKERSSTSERSKAEGAGSKEGSSGSKKPGSRYVPSFIPPGLAALVNSSKEPEKKEEEKRKDRDRNKPRNIDHFMEELKMEQEMRERRSEHRSRESRQKGNMSPPTRFDELPEDLDGKLPGSFDDGDPQTTNLYVGNLAPQVDENFLLRTFGRFGPIASVKIMWPRTDEERRRQRNCGFVAFMNRGDAQAAKDEMQGVILFDYEVRIGWGKAVALPAQALPAPPPGQMAVRSKEGATAKVAWSGPGAPPPPSISSATAEVVVTPNVPDIHVVPPDDDHLRHIIDTLALYVLDDGCAFEQAIMERGRNHPLFKFLFDLGSKDHTYYVWRLYSFAQGDTLQRWRTEPFIMITGSGRWIPPPLPQQACPGSPEHEKGSSTTFAAGRGRIVEVLTESLTLKETIIPTKVARLMLVSDILHNSSAPVKNASAYRTKFEASLPDIMESFNELYRGITGRITAEALKERVLKVLQVWSDWFLFSDAYVNGLRATFLRSGNSGVPPFHSILGDAPPVKDVGAVDDVVPDGLPSGQDAALAIGEGAAARELLSLPIAELERRCRHNGLSSRGGREVMVARLLSLEDAEKQRNQEMDDGLRSYHRYGAERQHVRDENWDSGKSWSESGMGSSTDRAASGGLHAHVGASENADRGLMIYDNQDRQTGSLYGKNSDTTKGSLGPLGPTFAIPPPDIKVFGTKSQKTEPVLPASKWTREDEDDDLDKAQGLGLSYSSSESEDIFATSERAGRHDLGAESAVGAANDSSIDEERRQKLRRLEGAVIEYRESLEERGIKNAEEIERKVHSHRKKLLQEYGLLDATGDGKASERRTTHSMERNPERKDKRDDKRESSSKKRPRSGSRSSSPYSRERSSRDRERDKEREKDSDWDCERDALRDYDDREKVRNSELRREREREKNRSKDDYDRERDRDREKLKERERERERERTRRHI